eukprot:5122612-Pyramimonas_sp.AAC.1
MKWGSEWEVWEELQRHPKLVELISKNTSILQRAARGMKGSAKGKGLVRLDTGAVGDGPPHTFSLEPDGVGCVPGKVTDVLIPTKSSSCSTAGAGKATRPQYHEHT